jgi:protein involved in polysaccharide export with SLBB domain
VLVVERELELTDTFVVTSERYLELPDVGRIDLAGVLRSELDDRLQERIEAFVNDPIVHVQTGIRVGFSGHMAAPGFYVLPPDMPLSEAIMFVGGPSEEGNVSKLRVVRGKDRILDGQQLQVALRQGRTLEELGMRTGDEVVVPRRSVFAPGEIASTVTFVVGMVFLLDRVIR